MSWQDAHDYRRALRTAREDLEFTDGTVLWRPEYAEIFGSPQRLLLALRSYWDTMVAAQLEADCGTNGQPDPAALALARANRGLLRALVRAQSGPLEAATSDLVTDGDVALEGAA